MPLGKTIAQSIFKRMVRENLPAMEMIRMAAKFGGSYRKTDMLRDIRTYTGRVKYENQILNLPSDAKVPRAWMSESVLKEPGANYRVFGNAEFYDSATGETYPQKVSFYHTDHLEGGEYEQEFDDFFRGKYKEQGIELISFQESGLEHNIGKPY